MWTEFLSTCSGARELPGLLGLRSFPLSTSCHSALPLPVPFPLPLPLPLVLTRTSNRWRRRWRGRRRRRREEEEWGRGKRGKWVGERREGRAGEGKGVEGKGRRNEEDIPAPPLQASNSSRLGNSCSENWKKTVCRPVTITSGFQMIYSRTTPWALKTVALLSQGVTSLKMTSGHEVSPHPQDREQNLIQAQ